MSAMASGPAARAFVALLLALACAQVAQAGCPMAGLWKDAARAESEQAAGGARHLAAVGRAPPPPPKLPLPVRIAMDSAAAAASGCNISRLIAQGPEIPPRPKQGAVDNRVKWWAWQVMTSPVVGMGTPTRPNWRVPIAAFTRLAFHDAGTYERARKRGGANGSSRFEPEEMASRMDVAKKLAATWRSQINVLMMGDPTIPFGTAISFADVYQLAGAIAVSVHGGPNRTEFYHKMEVGRVDGKFGVADNPQVLPQSFHLFDRLACNFLGNGYTLGEMVALSGIHTIGFESDLAFSPPEVIPMSGTPLKWDLDYYRRVASMRGHFDSDNALMQNAVTKSLVQKYSRDLRAFNAAYVAAYIKMGRMGARFRSYDRPYYG